MSGICESSTYQHTFLDGVSVAGYGKPLKIKAFKGIAIEISSSADNTARTIAFYEKMLNGTLVLISGVNRNGFATGVSTTGTSEVWEFSIAGGNEIVPHLSSITGGTVTIKGKAVA